MYETISDRHTELCQSGLLGILEDILRQVYTNCSYAELNRRLADLIISSDNGACPAHMKDDNNIKRCPFIPKYRCNSPTFLKVFNLAYLKIS
jgi:hypothetical protein